MTPRDDREPDDAQREGSDHEGAGQQSREPPRSRNTRYRMSTDLAAQGVEFLVLNDAGEHAFRFNGRAITNDDTIQLEDLQGHVLYEAYAHGARKQPRIVIADARGMKIGCVVRQQISPLRDRFTFELSSGKLLSVDGNVIKHEFSITDSHGRVAEVSQKWFRARGSYGAEIPPGQEDGFLLTSLAVLDQMI
jgi:uncharacterized protein YxjI